MAICCSLSPKSFLASLPPRGRGRGGGRAVPSRIFWKAPELVVRAAMVDSSESSASFARRMERAWLISQVSSSWATTCCVKCPQEILPVLYVTGRDLFAVLIAKAQASVPGGWENLHAKNNSLVVTLIIC
ncbi:uncharacterized protein [Elaeis guineensis]|uniref:Uncharacterized protein LOC105050750 isoform X2 n=1 Tax=Elaeis guineensis var. tenera TaxID=51953 RepID=A0A6I9RME9_ELAGV|nr:uncharacterized protein LOC105050750 isoform X2 [Elaeis guineensis]